MSNCNDNELTWREIAMLRQAFSQATKSLQFHHIFGSEKMRQEINSIHRKLSLMLVNKIPQ